MRFYKALIFITTLTSCCLAVPTGYEYNYAPAHDYGGHKDYSFSYGVKDLHSGDVKHQWEQKKGDTVRGRYALLEPDGSVRVVDYTAGAKSGFNAVVQHKGPSLHPAHEQPISFKELNIKEEPGLESYVRTSAVPKEQAYFPTNHKLTSLDYNQEKYLSYPYNHQSFELKEEDSHDVGSVDNYQYYEKPQTTLKPYTSKPTYFRPTPVAPTEKASELIDLSLLKPNINQHELDVEQINPVVIDLTKHSAHSAFKEPQVEHDFKPIRGKFSRPMQEKPIYGKPVGEITRPVPNEIPNTFRTNKKPASTPGLRNYASGTLNFANYYGYAPGKEGAAYGSGYGYGKEPLHLTKAPRKKEAVRPHASHNTHIKHNLKHNNNRQQKYITFLSYARPKH